MTDTILDVLPELAVAPVALATSTLASSPGASVLSSQNELLREKTSKAGRISQARKSKPSGEFQEASALSVVFELLLDLSKPLL